MGLNMVVKKLLHTTRVNLACRGMTLFVHKAAHKLKTIDYIVVIFAEQKDVMLISTIDKRFFDYEM